MSTSLHFIFCQHVGSNGHVLQDAEDYYTKSVLLK